MTAPVVLIRHAWADAFAEGLRARRPRLRIVKADEARLAEQLAEADILMAFQFPAEFAAEATKLRWFQSTGAGVDTVLPVAHRLPDMTITNARGIHGDAIADYVFAGITMMKWDFRRIMADQSHHAWNRRPVVPLSALTLGVVGVGAIGEEICRRGKSAGMTVLGYRRTAGAASSHVDEMFTGQGLHAMLPRCDAVVLIVPKTPETAGMIGAHELSLMKRDGILINVARGGIVDEAALAAALRNGEIGGAVLDVFDTEPLPPDSAFWDLPNVIVTPHMSGGTADYVERVLSIFCDNLDRFVAGQKLRNVVDPARGY